MTDVWTTGKANKRICSLCGNLFIGYGHNPEPLARCRSTMLQRLQRNQGAPRTLQANEADMTRCECGQYPDVCARYGHAGGDDGITAPLEQLDGSEGHTEASGDRLARVQPRSTYVIRMWALEPRMHHIIGPFTKREAERILGTLTCGAAMQRLTTEVPKWARLGTGRLEQATE